MLTLCPCFFRNHLEEEEKAECCAVIVFQMYCYNKYSVALPQCAWVVGFISLQYSVLFTVESLYLLYLLVLSGFICSGK